MARLQTLIIDNYDSFTFNLFQYLGELKGNPLVRRNDEITLNDVEKLKPTHIVISPGPGRPDDPDYFGVNLEIILNTKIPLLGVCLGHQGICAAFGGKIVSAPKVMHGKTSEIQHNQKELFRGILSPLVGMRYHSLIADKRTIPAELKITATERRSGVVMAVQHVERPIYGIQFHPESVGTVYGKKILRNFLS